MTGVQTCALPIYAICLTIWPDDDDDDDINLTRSISGIMPQGRFPSWQQVMPDIPDDAKTIVIDPTRLAQLLQIVATAGQNCSRDYMVALTLYDDDNGDTYLRVSRESPDDKVRLIGTVMRGLRTCDRRLQKKLNVTRTAE